MQTDSNKQHSQTHPLHTTQVYLEWKRSSFIVKDKKLSCLKRINHDSSYLNLPIHDESCDEG